MVLIKKYRVRKSGERGMAISIPPAFTEQLGLQVGDVILAYREDDKLILMPEKAKVHAHD